jgi:tRNA 2-thiouridine synthesizing protein D
MMEDPMMGKKTLTFMLMDAPFENARTTTALRLIDIAARRGYDINVFAYEGAVYLPLAAQTRQRGARHRCREGPSAAARMGRGGDAG